MRLRRRKAAACVATSRKAVVTCRTLRCVANVLQRLATVLAGHVFGAGRRLRRGDGGRRDVLHRTRRGARPGACIGNFRAETFGCCCEPPALTWAGGVPREGLRRGTARRGRVLRRVGAALRPGWRPPALARSLPPMLAARHPPLPLQARPGSERFTARARRSVGPLRFRAARTSNAQRKAPPSSATRRSGAPPRAPRRTARCSRSRRASSTTS